MKKNYLAPVAKTIDLTTEESLLLTVSGETDGDGTGEWGDSNRRDNLVGGGLWDNMEN